MSEKIKSEIISRRGTFSLVWKAAAATLAVPAVLALAVTRSRSTNQRPATPRYATRWASRSA